MFFNRNYYSPKKIVLEVTFQKIPFEDYMKITRMDEIDTIEDLEGIISDESFEYIELRLREEFLRQTIWYMAVFDIIMGIDRSNDKGYREYNID